MTTTVVRANLKAFRTIQDMISPVSRELPASGQPVFNCPPLNSLLHGRSDESPRAPRGPKPP